MHYLTFFLFYLFVVPAIALASSFVLRLERHNSNTDLTNAGFLTVFIFLVYALNIILGTLSILSTVSVLLMSSILIIILYRYERQRTLCRVASITGELHKAMMLAPPLLLSVCIVVFFHLSTPIQEGDSLGYHLPSVWDMISNSSTTTFNRDRLFNPTTYTNYYQRGMEVIYTFCYLFPLPRLSIFLLKLVFFSSMYFFIKSASRSRFSAACITALLLSCGVITNDIASLKNDLPLALLIVYSTYLLRHQQQGHLSFVSLTAALALSIAIKANALFYVACLCPLWFFHEQRNLPRFAGCLIIAAIFGGYFYFANFLHTRTPLYPFGVVLFNHTIFPGQTATFDKTTILANLNGGLLFTFVRGTLCALGPAGCLVCIGAIVIGILYHSKRFIQGHRSVDHALDLLILALFALGYIITPFSDRNSPVPHNLLLSGNTIRLGLPFFFWAIIMSTKIAAVNIKKLRCPAVFITTSLFMLIYANMSWTNLFFLVMKPCTAFGPIASFAGSFNNLTLGIIFITASILLGFLSIARWKFTVPVVIIISAIIYQVHYPSSLSYSSRFKPMQINTSVFRFLNNLDMAKHTIALHSSMPYSPFVCSMNDFLLRPGNKVKYIENSSQIDSSEMVIICAIDTVAGVSFLTGHTYRPTLSFFDTNMMPERYKKIFSDDSYIVYELSAKQETYNRDFPAHNGSTGRGKEISSVIAFSRQHLRATHYVLHPPGEE